MGKLRVAIIGYGRIGRIIERVGKKKGEEIVCIIDHQTWDEAHSKHGERAKEVLLEGVDVVLCFVTPESGYQVTKEVLMAGKDIVVGTTKFYLMPDQRTPNQEMLNEFRDLAIKNKCRMIYAANFGMGMQIVFEIVRLLSRMASKLGYDPGVIELHHDRKVDVSGTAKRIGNIMLEEYLDKTTLNFGDATRKKRPEEIMISSLRAGYFPGEHRAVYDGRLDTIVLLHTARDPTTFAEGALDCSRWIRKQPPGVYQARDRFLK